MRAERSELLRFRGVNHSSNNWLVPEQQNPSHVHVSSYCEDVLRPAAIQSSMLRSLHRD